MTQKPINVLFVCAGNICRSPMTEGVFQHMVEEAGLADVIKTDSAGTGSWHVGETAHSGTLDVLKRNGIAYRGRARQLTRDDLDKFDYVLAMDHENLSYILRAARGASADIRLFLNFANEAGRLKPTEVPDPYHDGTFDRVYNLVYQGNIALLDHIKQTHKLFAPDEA
ncbi:MAG: low molecular weight protein-tyrosine-phosphatase [Chloroflexota bacterium]|nr:low molecular weight protein-tyrosine-phosphatase [Chloroflexota bacterium]